MSDDAGARTDAISASLDDWRGETLARMRELIRAADPDIVEEIKWVKPSNPAGGPTWSHDGIICTGEVNASLDAGTRRAIDIKDGAKVDAAAFKANRS